MRNKKEKSVSVYLLHFEQPISDKHTAQHYLGSAADLQKRLDAHKAGQGSRLCEVATERGIGWELVRVWTPKAGEDGRLIEKKLKAQHNGKKLCPLCAAGGHRVIEPDVNFYQ